MNKLQSIILILCLCALPFKNNGQSIPVEITRNGHIMIPAKINGVEGKFIFDTGAGVHVISKKFYQKIKSQVQDSTYATGFRHTGERLDGYLYQFEELTLAQLKSDRPQIGVYPGFDELGFDGIISCKILEDEAVTFDLKNRQLIPGYHPANGMILHGEVPLLTRADRDRSLELFIPMVIGKKFTALAEFDTGAGYATLQLHTRYMEDADLDTTKMEIRNEPTGYGRKEKIYMDQTKQLHLQVNGIPEGEFRRIKFRPTLIYEGLAPYTMLGDVLWVLDIPNRKIALYK